MSAKIEKEKKLNSNLPSETIYNLLLIGKWVYEKSTEHLKQYALSVEQYNVLLILENLKGKPANMGTIQNSMISKMSNTTRLVEKLRVKGFLTREQSQENRRKVNIKITDKGTLLVKEINLTKNNNEKKIVQNLTNSNMQTLNKLLVKLKS